ncbi:MAG: DoxX family protein [Acidobacteriota bacterium]|nr:DoxX family protein [Acidobacteriota bacterium]
MNMLTAYAPHAARILLGLMFFVFGLNGFFHFLPQPAPEGAAAQFMGGLAAAPYFFPMLKGAELLIGLALLGNRFVPLALTILAPISVNIIAYNFFMSPSGIGISLFLAVLQIYLMWSYREAYKGTLAVRVQLNTTEQQTAPKTAHA